MRSLTAPFDPLLTTATVGYWAPNCLAQLFGPLAKENDRSLTSCEDAATRSFQR